MGFDFTESAFRYRDKGSKRRNPETAGTNEPQLNCCMCCIQDSRYLLSAQREPENLVLIASNALGKVDADDSLLRKGRSRTRGARRLDPPVHVRSTQRTARCHQSKPQWCQEVGLLLIESCVEVECAHAYIP